MSENDFRQKLARLQTLIAIRDAQVRADPLKYLREMEGQCVELLKVLDDVKYALSPDCVFDFWQQECDGFQIRRPADIQGEALIRCNKALGILQTYQRGGRA